MAAHRLALPLVTADEAFSVRMRSTSYDVRWLASGLGRRSNATAFPLSHLALPTNRTPTSPMTKYIFVTGGVVIGGKGVTAASIGRL